MTIFFGNGSGNLAADRRYEMARALMSEGDFIAAADLIAQAIELAPHWPPLYFEQGEAFRLAEDFEQSRQAFSTYLKLDPDDRMGATIKCVLINADHAPPSLPQEYVRSLFDQYAPDFDHALVEALQYRTPAHIHDAVLPLHPGVFDAVLDLGCGTGLAAELFRPAARHITGVDLSPVMINVARMKNIYDALYVEDLLTFLETTTKVYDLVLSADVFVYVGALEQIFEHISGRLAENGLFAFSVQKSTTRDWCLGDDHRYAHSRRYIERCAARNGMAIKAAAESVLRLDGGHPINGYLFVCGKD